MRRPLFALIATLIAAAGIVGGGVAVALGNESGSIPSASPPRLQPDRNFAVAAPGNLVLRGGYAPYVLPCGATQIQASAVTRRSAEGVVGVISIHGRGCGLQISPIRLRLLGSNGRPLLVGQAPGNPVNAAFSVRPDIVEGGGSASLGFAWIGFYCGPAPTSVEIRLFGEPFQIPLSGPIPTCTLGLTSALVPGVVEYPGSPVIPAPVAWESLRARLVLPAAVPLGPIPLTVVLTNVSTRDVSLAVPCPSYQTVLTYVTGSSDSANAIESQGDLCSRALTVRAGKSLRLDLGHLDGPGLTDGSQGVAATVTWSMAGVPPANGSTIVG